MAPVMHRNQRACVNIQDLIFLPCLRYLLFSKLLSQGFPFLIRQVATRTAFACYIIVSDYPAVRDIIFPLQVFNQYRSLFYGFWIYNEPTVLLDAAQLYGYAVCIFAFAAIL